MSKCVIGSFIKKKRINAGVSLRKAAEHVGLTVYMYQQREFGNYKFSPDEQVKLCELLKISPAEIIFVGGIELKKCARLYELSKGRKNSECSKTHHQRSTERSDSAAAVYRGCSGRF